MLKRLRYVCNSLSCLIIHELINVISNYLQGCLEEAKEKKLAEIKLLETKCADLKSVMTDLKAQLYAKFGSHINLEAEED